MGISGKAFGLCWLMNEHLLLVKINVNNVKCSMPIYLKRSLVMLQVFGAIAQMFFLHFSFNSFMQHEELKNLLRIPRSSLVGYFQFHALQAVKIIIYHTYLSSHGAMTRSPEMYESVESQNNFQLFLMNYQRKRILCVIIISARGKGIY